jgi:hypothetical protein
MTPEYWFNSLDLRTASHKKQLQVKTDRHVSTSHSAVTAVTVSCEVRPYAPPIPEIALGTGRDAW